jgi:hypothetical protein
MAITGTGSSTDPHIVNNWAELVSAAATTGIDKIYIKFKEGVVEDLSDTSQTVYNSCPINVDFNGAIFYNGKFGVVFADNRNVYNSSVYNDDIYITNGTFLNFRVTTSFMKAVGNNGYQIGFRIMRSVLDIYLDGASTFFWQADAYAGVLRYCNESRLTIHGMGSIGAHAVFHDSIVDLDLVAKQDIPSMDSSGVNMIYKTEGSSEEIKHTAPLRCDERLFTASDNNNYYPVRTRNTLYIDSSVKGRIRNMEGVEGDTLYLCCSENSIIEVECTYLCIVHAAGHNLINKDKTTPLYYINGMIERNSNLSYARTVSPNNVFSRSNSEIRNDNVLYELGFSVKPPEGS